MNHEKRRKEYIKGVSDPCPKLNCKVFLVLLLKHLSIFLLYLCWKLSCYEKNKLMYNLRKLIEVSNVHRFRERCNQYKRHRAHSLYWHSLSPLVLSCLFTADWKVPLHLNRQPTHWSSHVKVRCHLQENFRGFHHPSPPFAGNSFNMLSTETKLLTIPNQSSGAKILEFRRSLDLDFASPSPVCHSSLQVGINWTSTIWLILVFKYLTSIVELKR